MSRWIDRLTLSQRKVVFALVAVLLVGLGVYASGLPGEMSAPPAPAPAPSPSPSASPSPAPVAVATEPLTGLPNLEPHDEPVVVEGLNADEAPLEVADADLAAAQEVAEQFSAEYATRSWDETAFDRLARLEPFMSPELASAFAADGGGAALEDERRRTQEVTTAEPEFAYPQSVTADQVVFTVVVVQSVSSTAGTEERRPSFQVVVEPGPAGWRVVNMVA